MKHKVDVAVIGAGSAGLSALRQASRETDHVMLIDRGPLGTTCARIGCMPSKALIETALEYYRRSGFRARGIHGASGLSVSVPEVLAAVREQRDRFVEGMVEATRRLAGDRLVEGNAFIEGPQRIIVNGERVDAGRIVIATGSRPLVPGDWRALGDRILTSENLFEQQDLPARLAVIGLGPIGLELGQALARLGIDITAVSLLEQIGGLTDPRVNAAALEIIRSEFPAHLGQPAELAADGDGLIVTAGDVSVRVDKALVAMGVKPNVQGLGLENLGLPLNDDGLPAYDSRSGRVGDLPVYIAGDVNGCRPILHEALDEGFAAGRNAGRKEAACYCRRIALRVVFSDPQMAVVGQSYGDLDDADIAVGSVDFAEQSRAVILKQNRGLLRLYADKASACLLGAEMVAPGAEHVAHLLALAVQEGLNVLELLQLPFYHPTLEEGLRTALRDLRSSVARDTTAPELSLCGSCPEDPLC